MFFTQRPCFMRAALFIFIIIALVPLASCSLIQFRPDNLSWARTRGISYSVLEVAAEKWEEVAKTHHVAPVHPCFFLPPKTIVIHAGTYIERYEHTAFGEIIERRVSFKDQCFNHELGHLREYLEGKPYHSTYAW